MGTDVAAFAKQLKEDGIEAAKTEGEKIIAEARKEAEKIIHDGKIEVEKYEKEAQERIAQHKQRSEAEMQLVARDLINGLRKQIEKAASSLLRVKVADSLNDQEVIKSAIAELVKTIEKSHDWEVALGEKVAKPLASIVPQLFAAKDAKVTLANSLKKAGFEIKDVDGGEVIEVTEESVTAAFSNFLSPELKKLL